MRYVYFAHRPSSPTDLKIAGYICLLPMLQMQRALRNTVQSFTIVTVIRNNNGKYLELVIRFQNVSSQLVLTF